jgi:hypothetical protein
VIEFESSLYEGAGGVPVLYNNDANGAIIGADAVNGPDWSLGVNIDSTGLHRKGLRYFQPFAVWGEDVTDTARSRTKGSVYVFT